MTTRRRHGLLLALASLGAAALATGCTGGSANGTAGGPTAKATTNTGSEGAGPCYGYNADGELNGPPGCTPPPRPTVPANAHLVPCPEPTAPTGRRPQRFVCYLAENGQLMGVEVQ